jgi:hypothetical protein
MPCIEVIEMQVLKLDLPKAFHQIAASWGTESIPLL